MTTAGLTSPGSRISAMTNDILSDPDSTRELTALLLATDTSKTYVQQVVELAADRVHAGSSCGLTLRRDGRTRTVASSDALANQVDELQYDAGTGPCLEAMDTQTVVLVVDLGIEDRWGDYRLTPSAKASGLPCRSRSRVPSPAPPVR